jgi:hypothetical protein
MLLIFYLINGANSETNEERNSFNKTSSANPFLERLAASFLFHHLLPLIFLSAGFHGEQKSFPMVRGLGNEVYACLRLRLFSACASP